MKCGSAYQGVFFNHRHLGSHMIFLAAECVKLIGILEFTAVNATTTLNAGDKILNITASDISHNLYHMWRFNLFPQKRV